MSIKQCSKCGVSFGCASPQPGCWCEQYVLSAGQLQELRDKFSDCLCEQCLAEVAAETQPSVTE